MEFYKRNPELKTDEPICINGKLISGEDVVAGDDFKQFSESLFGSIPKLVRVNVADCNEKQIAFAEEILTEIANKPPRHSPMITSSNIGGVRTEEVIVMERANAERRSVPEMPMAEKASIVTESTILSNLYTEESFAQKYCIPVSKSKSLFDRFGTLEGLMNASNVELRKVNVAPPIYSKIRDTAKAELEAKKRGE